MSLYKLFGTDETAEQEGFDLNLYDGDEVIVFRLARAGGSNRRFVNRIQSLSDPFQRVGGVSRLSEERGVEILCQALSETVILGWKNVQDENGEEIPFSIGAAKQLLLELPELRNVIFEEAQKISNFAKEKVEEDEGN